jgi:hypothetical protein
MPSWLTFAILYIVHGTQVPYPDYYYAGPINELREACRGYWPAVVLHGYKPVDREKDDDTDLITVGADGQTYLCDYELAPIKGLDTNRLWPVDLSLP